MSNLSISHLFKGLQHFRCQWLYSKMMRMLHLQHFRCDDSYYLLNGLKYVPNENAANLNPPCMLCNFVFWNVGNSRVPKVRESQLGPSNEKTFFSEFTLVMGNRWFWKNVGYGPFYGDKTFLFGFMGAHFIWWIQSGIVLSAITLK